VERLYSWSTPTPPSRGTRRSPRLNQAETALVVTPQRPDPKWSPTILGVFWNSHGETRITLNWIKISQSNSVQETLPICWVRLTLPERTRNIPHDPWLAFWRFAELSEWHGPCTYRRPCPSSLQGDHAPPAPGTQGVGSEPNGLLLPSVDDLTTTVEDLMYRSTEATLIAPDGRVPPGTATLKRPVHRRTYSLTRQTATMVRPHGHLLPFTVTGKPRALQSQTLSVQLTATHEQAWCIKHRHSMTCQRESAESRSNKTKRDKSGPHRS